MAGFERHVISSSLLSKMLLVYLAMNDDALYDLGNLASGRQGTTVGETNNYDATLLVRTVKYLINLSPGPANGHSPWT